MSPEQAADVFNAAHPDGEPGQCGENHSWSDWGFNHVGDCEYRLCAECGGMEQQWISSDHQEER